MACIQEKLFSEQKTDRAENPAAILQTVRGETLAPDRAAALNGNAQFVEAINDMLDALYEHHTYGALERYVIEEHLLFGESRETIAAAIAAHAADLVDDLLASGLRALRHPESTHILREF